MTERALEADLRLRIAPHVYARAFGEEIVLLDFKRGEYFGLDEVSAHVWRAIESGQTLRAIADSLATLFEVTTETALADTRALVTQLLDERLVEVA